MEEDYVAEDEVEDHEVEDDDVKGEEDDDVEEEGPIPRPRTTLRESLRSRNACQHFTKATWKFTGKIPRPKSGTRTLFEPAQSKCMSTCYKSHSIQKFAGKMPRPSAAQIEPRTQTHTCSEISYRITDVECIARAQTLHLNLTGESG